MLTEHRQFLSEIDSYLKEVTDELDSRIPVTICYNCWYTYHAYTYEPVVCKPEPFDINLHHWHGQVYVRKLIQDSAKFKVLYTTQLDWVKDSYPNLPYNLDILYCRLKNTRYGSIDNIQYVCQDFYAPVTILKHCTRH